MGTRARGNRVADVDVDIDDTTAVTDHARVGAGPPPAGVAGERRVCQHRCRQTPPMGTRARGNRVADVDVDIDDTTAFTDHARVGAGPPQQQH